VKTVAHASPVVPLETLDVESSSKDNKAQQYDTDKAEIYSPQYVAFYVQCPFLSAVAFAQADLFLVMSCIRPPFLILFRKAVIMIIAHLFRRRYTFTSGMSFNNTPCTLSFFSLFTPSGKGSFQHFNLPVHYLSVQPAIVPVLLIPIE
jgi:hypothetical protein